MKKKKLISSVAAAVLAINLVSPMLTSQAALVGYKGDIDNSMTIDTNDVKALAQHVLDTSSLYDTDYFYADMDTDQNLNAVDICLLKRALLGVDAWQGIYEDEQLIETPIAQLDASCPSTGNVKMLVFEIEFSDCTFSSDFDSQEVEDAIFGPEDTSSQYYPYESVTAYLDRASYGRFNMTGDVFTYTASGPITDYNDDKVKLVEEVLDYFTSTVDFTEYDANDDGLIDCSAYFVPSSADSQYWWPCSGAFGDPSYRIDGLGVGNIITGNSVPTSHTDYVTTIIHEMGHAMGLPDYYKYEDTSDWEGLHGNAGYEMMDDAYGDYSSFSKLMLGWYQESEITVYDKSKGTQTFSLASSQHSPDFIIIPGEELGDSYFGEYFVIEYVTDDQNNTMWWNENSGIRILHIQSELYTYEYWGISCFAYDNYGPRYQGDDGVRVIRLVNDSNGYFESGDIVDSSVSGFAWYDESGQETVDTGITVSVGSLVNGEYTITISAD